MAGVDPKLEQALTKRRNLRTSAVNGRDPGEMLEVLLALDQLVMELSMYIYNIPHDDQFVMRKQNRRLHRGFSKNLRRRVF